MENPSSLSLVDTCAYAVESNFEKFQITELLKKCFNTNLSEKTKIRLVDILSIRTIYICDLLSSISERWLDLLNVLLRWSKSRDIVGLEQAIISVCSDAKLACTNLYLSKFTLMDKSLVECKSGQSILLLSFRDLFMSNLKLSECSQNNTCIEFEKILKLNYSTLIINHTDQANILHKLHKDYRLLKENTKILCIEGREIDYKTSTKLTDFFIGLLLRNLENLIISDMKSHIAHGLALRFNLLKMYNRGWAAINPAAMEDLPNPVRHYRLNLKHLRLDNLSPVRPMKTSHMSDFKTLLTGRTQEVSIVNCQLSYPSILAIGHTCRQSQLKEIFLQNVFMEGDVLCALTHMFCKCGCFASCTKFKNDQRGISLHVDTAYSRILHQTCLYICTQAGCITDERPLAIQTFHSPLIEICLSNVLVSVSGLRHLACLLRFSCRLKTLMIRYLIVTPKFDNVHHNPLFNSILEMIQSCSNLEYVHLEGVPVDEEGWKILFKLLDEPPQSLRRFVAIDFLPQHSDNNKKLQEFAGKSMEITVRDHS